MTWNTGWPPSQQHSLEVEHRLTSAESFQEHQERVNDRLDKRVGALERMLQIVLYAIAALATAKTGDLADVLLAVLKRSP